MRKYLSYFRRTYIVFFCFLMASEEMDSLDEEIRELLQNYKYKKATVYEPCTLDNFKNCLIGLTEEFSLLNIAYYFNPHNDLENETLRPEALVQLINSVWTLLHYHKNTKEKAERLMEHNHILEHNNKQLTLAAGRLKDKLNTEKNESKACVASAQRVSDQSNEVYQKLQDTRNKLKQLTKQKESNEKIFQNKITRMKLENEKLLNCRRKSDGYTSCTDICDGTLMQMKERERKHKALIAQLQTNNQELLREVLALKEELILEGINNVTITK